jgi:Sigma-70 region 2
VSRESVNYHYRTRVRGVTNSPTVTIVTREISGGFRPDSRRGPHGNSAHQDEQQAATAIEASERDALIIRHRGLAELIASDYRDGARAAGIDQDDVISAGYVGLCKAADRFRPERGKFRHYCRKWVRGAIRRELRIKLPYRTGLDLRQVADHRVSFIPSLEPLFGSLPFVPFSECPHREPIRSGPFVCMRCHQCAYDSHPLMQITPADLTPGRRRHYSPPAVPGLPKTRRERRFNSFGAAS